MDKLNFDNLINIEDNLYCLNDIAEKLIHSKNVKEYMKKKKNKKLIKDKYYISKDDMKYLLLKCKTTVGQQYLNFINEKYNENIIMEQKDNTIHITTKEELKSKIDNRKFIDHGTNEIIYNNNKILFFEYNEILYLRAKDICDLLGYSNSRREIDLHVDKEDIFSFNNIEGNKGSNNLLHHHSPYNETSEYINLKLNKDIDQLKNIKLIIEEKINKFIDPQTIFINESGLYSLILSSKMPEAKKFKHWVTNDVLISIRKTGSYNRVYSGLLYDEVKLKELENIPCVYLIHVRDSLYKFGRTRQSLKRMNTHKNNLDYNEIIKIYEFPNLDLAINTENRIKKYTLNSKIRKYLEEGVEFFEINKDYSIERILKDINLMVENEISIYDKKINMSKLDSLAYIENLRLAEYDKLIIIEKEKSKQVELEIRRKELEIEILKLKENKPTQSTKLIKITNTTRPTKTKKCVDCNNMISNKSTRCLKCLTKFRLNTSIRENNRPTLKQLEDELKCNSYINVGKKYNVSDNTIRNWIKQYKKTI